MENIKINGMSFLAGKWPLEKNNISIIFIHGSGLSKNLWVQQVDELSSYANTIAIDLPGHGESDGEACNRVEGYTKFVERIINELEITKPILCGLSMGGAVALHMILNPIMNYFGAVLLNTGAKLKVLECAMRKGKLPWRTLNKQPRPRLNHV